MQTCQTDKLPACRTVLCMNTPCLPVMALSPIVSSVTARKLDYNSPLWHSLSMTTKANKLNSRAKNTAEIVRRKIESGGDRAWRLADSTACHSPRWHKRCPAWHVRVQFSAWARAFITGPGRLPSALAARTARRSDPCILPKARFSRAGIAAANLLGFTTQNPGRIELATNGSSLPRIIVGKDAIIHTRRPEAWRTLSEMDAALLDFLRNRGDASELPPAETVEQLLGYFREPGRLSVS